MVKLIGLIAALVLGYVAFIIVMRLAFPLPPLPAAAQAPLAERPRDSALATSLAPLVAAHPGASGFVTLGSGADAFAARIHLARAASRAIDAQYYIWNDDLTGTRLLAELQAAAERGVTVRLLVDDNGTGALEQELVALDALPTAEVRLFNPFVLRRFRTLNYMFDFFRLNRRMHNKSFTVDGAVTVVGGRNIGDVYFETGGDQNYIDLDVLAVGPAAKDVSADFERYWTSRSAYAVASLITPAADAAQRLGARDLVLRDTEQGRAYAEYVHASSFTAQLLDQTLPLQWEPALLFSDAPGKVLGLAEGDALMVRRLLAEIGTPDRSIDLVSPYFVPGTIATEKLIAFAQSGLRVRVLTNSLEATDVVAVHGAYARYRADLVAGGVEVYELKSDGMARRNVRELEVLAQSNAAIHAKIFSVDRRRAFVGSLNFDPRSRRLNTEMGLLIDSASISDDLSGWLDANLASLAYRVSADEDGHLLWTATDPAGHVSTSAVDPNTTLPLRLLVKLIGLLPVEWLL
ncbi:phospholipase D family protein [Phaeovulum sp. W22_SRMD_FR3]|uniref:phospholipase D family protein n=1 Tax=Phaeovulum sp. W22_SRMD_FR3 TaxID=3240274 RepID=UPI003F952D65